MNIGLSHFQRARGSKYSSSFTVYIYNARSPFIWKMFAKALFWSYIVYGVHKRSTWPMHEPSTTECTEFSKHCCFIRSIDIIFHIYRGRSYVLIAIAKGLHQRWTWAAINSELDVVASVPGQDCVYLTLYYYTLCLILCFVIFGYYCQFILRLISVGNNGRTFL